MSRVDGFKKWAAKALISMVTLALWLGPTPLRAQETVVEIRVEGVERADKDVVKELIRQKIGRPVNRNIITEDIRRIYGLELFSNIEVHKESVEGGVALIYRSR